MREHAQDVSHAFEADSISLEQVIAYSNPFHEQDKVSSVLQGHTLARLDCSDKG